MMQILETFPKPSPVATGMALVQQQLRSSPYWSVRQLICVLDQGCVTLRGTLPSYYLKQVAQSVAAQTLGIDRVQSDIRVQSESPVRASDY
jgi:osmotically-inducible protein OsmY